MDVRVFASQDLLGQLNDVEQKNAPEKLFLAGDVGLLQSLGGVWGSREMPRSGHRASVRSSCRLQEGYGLDMSVR